MSADEDIWVGIGITEAQSIFAQDGGDSIEVARSITNSELAALDLEARVDKPPFSLVDVPGRGYRLARFDFSDHPYARDCWRWAVQNQTQSPVPALDVTCWRAGPRQKAEENGDLDYSFEPLSDAKHDPVSVADVVTQPLFELGVLFVHGIGKHDERETLVRWSEPLVKFWRDRALAINQAALAVIDLDERRRIRRWLETHALRSRAAIDGISERVTNLAQAAARAPDGKVIAQPIVRPKAEDPTACCVATKAEQTLFPNRNPGAPSSTLFRLSTVGGDGSLRESHVLFAESAWAREAFPPTPAELYAWLTKAIPIAVWARLRRLAITRPREIWKFGYQAVHPFQKFQVAASWLLLLLQILVLPTAYVILALASQIAIVLIGVLGLLPIPRLASGIRWVISGLMGTLGQSYALQASPVRRSAIVSSVALDIDWLSDNCQHTVIVSHSQGAEISRLAFLEARRDKMRRWYTAGAGIAPLNMLSPKSLDKPASKVVVWASNILLVAALLLVGTLLVDSIPGINLGVRVGTMQLAQGVRLEYILIAYVAFSMSLIALCAGAGAGPDVSPQLRRSLMEKWTDFFASEDPVPGGSLQDRWRDDLNRQGITGCKERRIFNTRFALLDHTTYFKNIEQFVAPIALDLLRYAGMGRSESSEQSAIDAAAGRREARTWWILAASIIATSAAAVSFALTAFGPARRASAWLVDGRLAWEKGTDFWERVSLVWSDGLAGMVLNDLWLTLLLVGMMLLIWIVSHCVGSRSVAAMIKDLADSARTAGA